MPDAREPPPRRGSATSIPPGLSEQILEAWRINHHINRRLVDCISDAGMRSTLSKRGGRSVVRQFAYLIAHESHHRGNILLTLKQSGHPVDTPTRYGIWDWDRM